MKPPASGVDRRTSPIASSRVALLAAVTCVALTAGVVVATAQNGSTAGKAAPKAAGKSTTKAASKAAVPNLEDFQPGNFDRSTQIDNEWMPLKPGTRFVYEGTSYEDKGTPVPHRLVINVTDLTKVIGGVRALMTWDLDYNDGELEEAELAFFAQDKEGNVWRMGEYTEEYSDGKFVVAAPWLHGLEDARAGIEMKAKPMPGTPSYSQGWGPAVHWTDRGQVDQVRQKTTVPAGSYEDVLVIAETSQSEPDAQQLKYFARGVGSVRVGWRGGGEKTKESLELTKIEKLDAKGLSEIREAALKLERAGYQHSKNVYAHTPPAERIGADDKSKSK